MAQYGVTVFRDDSEPSVLGSARTEASVTVYLGASGDLRAETHALSSSGTPTNTPYLHPVNNLSLENSLACLEK